MFETLLSLIFWGVMIFAVTRFLSVLRELNELEKNIESEYHEKLDELPEGVVAVIFEKIPESDTILCYSEDKRFLCQGKNFKEVQENFKLRFPDLTAIVKDKESKLLYTESLNQEGSIKK